MLLYGKSHVLAEVSVISSLFVSFLVGNGAIVICAFIVIFGTCGCCYWKCMNEENMLSSNAFCDTNLNC